MAKALATTTKNYAISKTDATLALTDALSEGESLGFGDLARIKTPAGGGKAWDLPGGEIGKTFEGVLLLRQPVRAYWSTTIDETGGGEPPSCSSLDSVTGIGDPGGSCQKCPQNEWGSAGEGRRGKACRQITRLFFLMPDSLLPVLYPAPPSAFNEVRRYVVGLAARGIAYHQVITAVGLDAVQNADGVAYSRPTFGTVGPIPEQELPAIAGYRAGVLPVLHGMTVDPDEAGL